MPIYEYLCKRCGAHLEAVQSIADLPLTTHEGCGGDLRKVFHPAGLVFRGSGFYTTDSRPKKGKGSEPREVSSKSKGGKEEE